MTLVLCGLPGCGKTTVGTLIAALQNRPFGDTDRLLESHYEKAMGKKLSCREILLNEGESFFRQLEHAILVKLTEEQVKEPMVLATGGGILSTSRNVDLLRSMGTLIYLRERSDVLLGRILRNGVPSYLDSKAIAPSFAALVNQRTPIYEAACHISVDTTGLSPDAVASKIIEMVNAIRSGRR